MAKYLRRPIKARNPWLVGILPGRADMIAGVMIHATRSGRVIPNEGEQTELWWSNPRNRVEANPPYGSYADALLFKDGTQIVCTDIGAGEYARWTAGYGDAGTWAAGHYYIQAELPQGASEPYTDAVIDSIAQWTAEWSKQYNFPIQQIEFLSQTGYPPRGIASHEASANGKKLGKSDPGPMFPWSKYLELARAYAKEADPVTREEFEQLRREVDEIRKVVAANGIAQGVVFDGNEYRNPDGSTPLSLLTGEAAWAVPVRQGHSLHLGIAMLQAQMRWVLERLSGAAADPAAVQKVAAALEEAANRLRS